MSMSHNPASGYLVPAADLAKLLPEGPIRTWYEKVLDEDGTEMGVFDWLEENWPEDLPQYEGVWQPSDEDELCDDIDRSTLYVTFNLTDLYVLTPTRGLLQMQAHGIEPLDGVWARWG